MSTDPSAPEVSVVMSVYNGADALPRTLHSVLSQEGVDFEFIVIDDGSTDASGRILDEWAASHPRLRVIHQHNTGLTRALIRGCAEARGEFIARQDCGDVSLPGRLAAQVAVLRATPKAVMVACGAQFLGPRDEVLYTAITSEPELERGLANLNLQRLQGPPHHGATLFRREAYQKAGGYRAPFVVAQDIDLWLRLVEVGRCVGQETVGYAARVEVGGISHRRRDEQFHWGRVAIDCALARRAGHDDAALLEAAVQQAPQRGSVTRPDPARERARFHYFVGSCLRSSDRQAARRYFRSAIQDSPWHVRAWFRYLLG